MHGSLIRPCLRLAPSISLASLLSSLPNSVKPSLFCWVVGAQKETSILMSRCGSLHVDLEDDFRHAEAPGQTRSTFTVPSFLHVLGVGRSDFDQRRTRGGGPQCMFSRCGSSSPTSTSLKVSDDMLLPRNICATRARADIFGSRAGGGAWGAR